MILDTSFIIYLMKNKPEALVKAYSLEKSSAAIRTTAITVFELWQGVEDIKDKTKREKIEQYLSSLGLLELDTESAKIAGTIYAQLRRSGEIIEAEDCLIAG